MQLGRRPAPVVPISPVAVPSPLYAVLRDYKDGPVAEARARCRRLVSSLFESFLERHLDCLEALAGGRLEVTSVVPPTSRPGAPPLAVPSCAPAAGAVLQRGPGRLGHLRASRVGFTVPPEAAELVACRRILLLEDTLTTGARAQSAAAALADAGAATVVVLVLGRVVRPGRSATHAGYWRRALRRPFSPERCCLEDR